MTKDEILKSISDILDQADGGFRYPRMRYDNKWRYPKLGDDQKTCPLLDFMFHTEYNSGFLIFVPDLKNKYGEPGNRDRNKEGE